MRIDEMILEAVKTGGVYICKTYSEGCVTYSNDSGFKYNGEPITEEYCSTFLNGWEMKPKRYLTVKEAEKELDCVINIDIHELLRPIFNPPRQSKRVIILIDHFQSTFTGKYSAMTHEWSIKKGEGIWYPCTPLCWIDPEDILRLVGE